MDYLVIQASELRDFKRFSTNSQVRDYIEEQLNEYGYSIDEFLVLRGDNMEGLSLDASKRVSVSVGGC
jgi:hypothetical protein